MHKAVVLFDGIRYTDDDGNVLDAAKNDEVDLTADEFDRLSEFGAVAKPGSKEAKAAAAAAPPAPADGLDDLKKDELEKLASDEGVDLTAANSNADRVAAIRAARAAAQG